MSLFTSDWFTVERLDKKTYAFSEYGHPEETHSYLLLGSTRSLVIDTGLGIGNIYEVIQKIATGPLVTVATHVHWDHIGGHRYFSDIYVHAAEVEWLSGNFPLPLSAVRKMVAQGSLLPVDFNLSDYQIFQGKPTKILRDCDEINLGDRTVTVIHTPGHSPGHMCFWEADRGYLYSGDLVYRGRLFANYPSTDPQAYLASLGKISTLSLRRLLPGHHSLDIAPEIIGRMKEKFQELSDQGKLRHGQGVFEFGDWSLQL